MEHFFCCHCCFVLLLVAFDLTVADVTSSMWASLYKQDSICQRHAFVLKVVCICRWVLDLLLGLAAKFSVQCSDMSSK